MSEPVAERLGFVGRRRDEQVKNHTNKSRTSALATWWVIIHFGNGKRLQVEQKHTPVEVPFRTYAFSLFRKGWLHNLAR